MGFFWVSIEVLCMLEFIGFIYSRCLLLKEVPFSQLKRIHRDFMKRYDHETINREPMFFSSTYLCSFFKFLTGTGQASIPA